MKKPGYVPDRGDIVWYEQRDTVCARLSPASYNRASGLMLCCSVTSHRKGYPFEVIISDDPHRTSVVLADQVKSFDWKTRQAVKKGAASSSVVMETPSKLQTLL